MSVMQPPWPARREADNWAMQRYLEIRLQNIEHAELRALYHDVPNSEPERDSAIDYAIECAEAGDVRLLQNELARRIDDPRIKRFINLLKLRKGERWSRKSYSQIAEAAAAVPVIQKFLNEYTGKKQRRKSDGWTAKQFAAEIFDVHVDQIERYLKRGRR
jgi:hypothetical protein